MGCFYPSWLTSKNKNRPTYGYFTPSLKAAFEATPISLVTMWDRLWDDDLRDELVLELRAFVFDDDATVVLERVIVAREIIRDMWTSMCSFLLAAGSFELRIRASIFVLGRCAQLQNLQQLLAFGYDAVQCAFGLAVCCLEDIMDVPSTVAIRFTSDAFRFFNWRKPDSPGKVATDVRAACIPGEPEE
jgi:hypothetical protein